MFASGGKSQPHRGIGLQPSEAMVWGHAEDALQLSPLSGTDLPFISDDSLPLLNANPYDAPIPGATTPKRRVSLLKDVYV